MKQQPSSEVALLYQEVPPKIQPQFIDDSASTRQTFGNPVTSDQLFVNPGTIAPSGQLFGQPDKVVPSGQIFGNPAPLDDQFFCKPMPVVLPSQIFGNPGTPSIFGNSGTPQIFGNSGTVMPSGQSFATGTGRTICLI